MQQKKCFVLGKCCVSQKIALHWEILLCTTEDCFASRNIVVYQKLFCIGEYCCEVKKLFCIGKILLCITKNCCVSQKNCCVFHPILSSVFCSGPLYIYLPSTTKTIGRKSIKRLLFLVTLPSRVQTCS